MDIKLLPNGKSKGKFVFSSLPNEIKSGNSARYQSFNIISQSTVKVPKGTDVKDISWNGEFFGEAKRQEAIVKTQYWKPPDKCIKTLENWMKKGTVLNLIVTGTWINMDVTISSFKVTPYGAYGNVKYDISFEEARELKIYTTKELKIGGSKKKKKTAKKRSTKKKVIIKEHIVRDRESLYRIAKTEMAFGDNWMELYQRNKDVLDGAAKKKFDTDSDHGRCLVSGTKIIIP